MRGKTVGVISEGKKYRLKTLGLLEAYESLVNKLEQEKEPKKQQQTKEEEKVASNENETKINSRREQMKKVRESKYAEARENK